MNKLSTKKTLSHCILNIYPLDQLLVNEQ